jgi:hypothetical protein
MKLFTQNPAFFLGVVQAALALGISFGLNLTSQQVGAILALTAAVLSLCTHQLVTPVSNPKGNDGVRLVAEKIYRAAA